MTTINLAETTDCELELQFYEQVDDKHGVFFADLECGVLKIGNYSVSVSRADIKKIIGAEGIADAEDSRLDFILHGGVAT